MTTQTINGSHPAVTVGGDVRVRVRAPETTPPEPLPAGDAQKTACHPRELPHEPDERHAQSQMDVRNFASRHVGEVREATATSWPLTERPRSLADVARATFPAKGEAGNVAVWTALAVGGVARTVGTAVGQMWLLAFATRIRATVTANVLVLIFAVHYLASALNP